jgi:hypothetical protein
VRFDQWFAQTLRSTVMSVSLGVLVGARRRRQTSFWSAESVTTTFTQTLCGPTTTIFFRGEVEVDDDKVDILHSYLRCGSCRSVVSIVVKLGSRSQLPSCIVCSGEVDFVLSNGQVRSKTCSSNYILIPHIGRSGWGVRRFIRSDVVDATGRRIFNEVDA